MMVDQNFPPGWDEERVRRVIAYYDQQSEEEAVAEDEAAAECLDTTLMEIPIDLVSEVRNLLEKARR